MLNYVVFCSVTDEPYVNRIHGYSINPPSDWTLDESEAPITVHFKNPEITMHISIYTSIIPSNSTLNQLVSAAKSDMDDDPDFKLISEGSLSIGELSGYEFVFTEYLEDVGFTIKNKVTMFVEVGRWYGIWFSVKPTDYDEYLPIFEESLETFKLVGKPLLPLPQLLAQLSPNLLFQASSF